MVICTECKFLCNRSHNDPLRCSHPKQMTKGYDNRLEVIAKGLDMIIVLSGKMECPKLKWDLSYKEKKKQMTVGELKKELSSGYFDDDLVDIHVEVNGRDLFLNANDCHRMWDKRGCTIEAKVEEK